MSFCPNPECPHHKKTGKPAEFIAGVACCSDCGCPLAEAIDESTESKQKSYISEFLQNDFLRRLFYTLSLVAIWRMLGYIAVPGNYFNFLENYFGRTGGDILLPRAFFRFTVLTLGLMPYITAYVLVEILALFMKPLKSWREGGYYGRVKLKKTALAATLILAIVQGYLIVNTFERMYEGQLFNNPAWLFQIIFILSITAGTFLSIGIADLITAKGIGHGVSVLIFTGLAAGFLTRLPKISKEALVLSPFEIIFLIGLIGIGLTALIILVEKSHRKMPVKFEDGKEAYIPLKLTTAGIVPAMWTSSIVMLPATIAGFIDNSTFQKIAVALSPGKPGHFIVLAIIIFFLYYLFTALFYRPERMAEALKNKGASFVLPEGKREREFIDRILEKMALIGFLYLSMMVLLNEIANYIFNTIVVTRGYTVTVIALAGGGLALIEVVAIALDLLGEAKMRRKSSLVKVAEFHDVPKAGLCKSILEGQGISCHLRGYYYRALLYFFGPYIEISVLVPEDKAEEAKEAISRYIE